jgi:hypothetical protein
MKISPSIGITASKNVSLSVLFFSTSSPMFVNSASSHCVSGALVDGYYGIGDVIDTITSEDFWDLTEKPDEAIK